MTELCGYRNCTNEATCSGVVGNLNVMACADHRRESGFTWMMAIEEARPILTRADCLDTFVREHLDAMSDKSHYDVQLPCGTGDNLMPQWWEIRESVVRVLFAMDREQAEHERHAEHVVKECL